MGTRAAFWIGDPRQLDAREWLGCKAWDGYPDSPNIRPILLAKSEKEFRKYVGELAKQDDFAKPDGGWPYPWKNDIFLTDFTYAWIDRQVKVARFYSPFVTVAECDSPGFEFGDDDPTMKGVSSGKDYDTSQPDSIMILRVGTKE